jgi:8-oxo-dGTP pyrophosphatase MutT (NUDIX family)
MGRAARAIIIQGDNLLVMHRHKYGNEYFTLVGGRVSDGESIEQALVREVKEETGLDVTKARPVFIERHAPPYSDQYIFLCEVAPFESAEIQATSEEGFMNRLEANLHKLVWVRKASFSRLQFRTPQLHAAIVEAIQKGFPKEPVMLTAATTPAKRKRTIFRRTRK